MTTLTDPFSNVKKKDLKNKAGEVVARVDYVGWSDVADRLDDAAPGWSFAIVNIGDDWCWGRLSLSDGRTFENIGYAENAEAAWKKEPLKDAVSDALKRCAALAGVARYLYGDHAAPAPAQRASAPQRPVAPVSVAPTPSGDDLDDDQWAGLMGTSATPAQVREADDDRCPVHGKPWKTVPAGTSKSGVAYNAFRACPEFGCKERPR